MQRWIERLVLLPGGPVGAPQQASWLAEVVAQLAVARAGGPTGPLLRGVVAEGWANVSAEQLQEALEAVLSGWRALGGEDRRSRGAWYTPRPLAEQLAAWTVPEALSARGGPLEVLDPAAGTGRLLMAVLRAAQRTGRSAGLRLVAVDVDAAALVVAGACLRWAAGADAVQVECVAGNALLGSGWLGAASDPVEAEDAVPVDWSLVQPGQGFDVVVLNPPFVGAARLHGARPWLRAGARAGFVSARGNWDLCCPFLELAARRTRPGGWCAAVVPNAVLAAPYGQAVRRLLAEQGALRAVSVAPGQGGFAAAAYPVLYHWQRATAEADARVQIGGGRSRPLAQVAPHDGGPWALGEAEPEDWARWDHLPRLGERVPVLGAATVGEAYALAPLLVDRPTPGPGDLRLVNSGTIDPYRALWGEALCRYLGSARRWPVLPADEVERLSPTRLAHARSPKVIVASMSRTIEAFADLEGGWLPGKSTTILLTTSAEEAAWWSAVLHSERTQRLFLARFAGLRVAGGHLRVGPPQLAQLPAPPLPPEAGELVGLVRRAGAGELEAAAALEAIVEAAWARADQGART